MSNVKGASPNYFGKSNVIVTLGVEGGLCLTFVTGGQLCLNCVTFGGGWGVGGGLKHNVTMTLFFPK